MGKRTLKDIEKDKKELDKLQADLGEQRREAEAALEAVNAKIMDADVKWEKLDEEWYEVRHEEWDESIVSEAESLGLNLKAYSTEEQLTAAVLTARPAAED